MRVVLNSISKLLLLHRRVHRDASAPNDAQGWPTIDWEQIVLLCLSALQRDAGNTPLAAQLEADGGIMRQLEGQLAPCEPLETRFGDADLDATS